MKRKDELALERIKCCVISEGYTDNDTFQDLVIIENSLNDYYRLLKEDNETTKKLKALAIIKEHWNFEYSISGFGSKGLVQIKPISMEDANLLSEVLL